MTETSITGKTRLTTKTHKRTEYFSLCRVIFYKPFVSFHSTPFFFKGIRTVSVLVIKIKQYKDIGKEIQYLKRVQ